MIAVAPLDRYMVSCFKGGVDLSVKNCVGFEELGVEAVEEVDGGGGAVADVVLPTRGDAATPFEVQPLEWFAGRRFMPFEAADEHLVKHTGCN